MASFHPHIWTSLPIITIEWILLPSEHLGDRDLCVINSTNLDKLKLKIYFLKYVGRIWLLILFQIEMNVAIDHLWKISDSVEKLDMKRYVEIAKLMGLSHHLKYLKANRKEN